MSSGYSFKTLESIAEAGQKDSSSLGGQSFVNSDYRITFDCIIDNPAPRVDAHALMNFPGSEHIATKYIHAMQTPGFLATGIFNFYDYGFFENCAQPIDVFRREAIKGEPICWGIDFADWYARTHELASVLDRTQSPGYIEQIMQKLRKHSIQGAAVIMSAPGQEIYGHWLLDIVPRLSILAQSPHTSEPILFNNMPEWGIYFLNIFGIDPSRIQRHPSKFFRVEQAIIPSASKSGFRLGQDSLKKAWSHVWDNCKSVAIDSAFIGEKIFFSRRQLTHSSRRSVPNVAEIEAAAERRGYKIVVPETLSIQQQIMLMRQARIVLGEDGSALHNIVFCSPGAKLGVLSLPERNNLWHLGICQLLDHRIAYLNLPAEPDADLDINVFNAFIDNLEA